MSGNLHIRVSGCAGRITLARPEALNAMTRGMCAEIAAAVAGWRGDDAVKLVVIDAEGDKAFCAGGDIQEIYHAGMGGDYSFARGFWAEEYRLNAMIAEYPKPYVAFMQGYTMGGGVGISCHGSHRVVCDSSRIAMPECGIGIVPDVGGSLLLANAPGSAGEYLACTSAMMAPGDAIHAGFADMHIPRENWKDLIAQMEETGEPGALRDAAAPVAPETLVELGGRIDAQFGLSSLAEILAALKADGTGFGEETLGILTRKSPLSLAAALQIVRRVRAGSGGIRHALTLEYRFNHRAIEHGELLEGIRAAVIDKDRMPKWKHAFDGDLVAGRGDYENLPNDPLATLVSELLEPLGDQELTFEE